MKTPDWQLAILPNDPQYWGATPTDSLPFLAISLESMSQTPRGSLKLSAASSQCRFPIQDSSHLVWLMSRWRLRTSSGPCSFRAMASMFFRSASLKSPLKYRSNFSAGSLRPKAGWNKAVNWDNSCSTLATSSTLSSKRRGGLGFQAFHFGFVRTVSW